MIAVCTYVTQETLMSVLKRIEQVSSITWPPISNLCKKYNDTTKGIDKCEQSKVEVLYYSEAWKGLLTYGPCYDHKGGYIAKSNEEFVEILAECLPK